MDAGRLRERVTIEGEVRKPNGQGGFTTGWATVARSVPAEIIGLTGDEALRLGVERSASQYRVTMRRRSDVSPKNRLKWKGQIMAIRSVVPDARDPNVAIVLTAEIGVGS